MDCFGVVAEGLLGEALGVAALERTLRPGVSVRVEGHSVDSKALAALLEFSGAIAGADGAEIWKQGAGSGAALEEGSDIVAEANDGRLKEW